MSRANGAVAIFPDFISSANTTEGAIAKPAPSLVIKRTIAMSSTLVITRGMMPSLVERLAKADRMALSLGKIKGAFCNNSSKLSYFNRCGRPWIQTCCSDMR